MYSIVSTAIVRGIDRERAEALCRRNGVHRLVDADIAGHDTQRLVCTDIVQRQVCMAVAQRQVCMAVAQRQVRMQLRKGRYVQLLRKDRNVWLLRKD